MKPRESDPNRLMIQFTAETVDMLTALSEQDSPIDERPNKSATLRALVRKEFERRKKSVKFSQRG